MFPLLSLTYLTYRIRSTRKRWRARSPISSMAGRSPTGMHWSTLNRSIILRRCSLQCRSDEGPHGTRLRSTDRTTQKYLRSALIRRKKQGKGRKYFHVTVTRPLKWAPDLPETRITRNYLQCPGGKHLPTSRRLVLPDIRNKSSLTSATAKVMI